MLARDWSMAMSKQRKEAGYGKKEPSLKFDHGSFKLFKSSESSLKNGHCTYRDGTRVLPNSRNSVPLRFHRAFSLPLVSV